MSTENDRIGEPVGDLNSTEHHDAGDVAGDDDPQEPDSGGIQPKTLLALLGTVVIVVILAVAVLADRGNGDDSNSTAEPNQAAETESQEAPSGGEAGDVELGSLSVTGYACPEASSPDEDCLEAGTVDITNAVFVLEDGSSVGMDVSTDMQDGSLAWLNVPTGTYEMTAASLEGPDGMLVRNVVGAVTPSDGGWTVSNLDPNQPAVIQVLFIPEGGSPAAG